MPPQKDKPIRAPRRERRSRQRPTRPGRLPPHPAWVMVVLDGGSSSRMGRRKSALKLDGQTLLRRIRGMARGTGWPTRVVRKDEVENCGPLGGVYTAFRRIRGRAMVFLACDMPFVRGTLVKRLVRLAEISDRAVFTAREGRVGFPFLLRRADLAVVKSRITAGDRSLRSLAAALQARLMPVDRSEQDQLVNINTPGQWAQVRAREKSRQLRLVKSRGKR